VKVIMAKDSAFILLRLRRNSPGLTSPGDHPEGWGLPAPSFAILRVKEAEIGEQMVRIYFNNHARSKAAANAFQLMDLLEIPHEPKKIRLQDQFTLGCF